MAWGFIRYNLTIISDANVAPVRKKICRVHRHPWKFCKNRTRRHWFKICSQKIIIFKRRAKRFKTLKDSYQMRFGRGGIVNFQQESNSTLDSALSKSFLPFRVPCFHFQNGHPCYVTILPSCRVTLKLFDSFMLTCEFWDSIDKPQTAKVVLLL